MPKITPEKIEEFKDRLAVFKGINRNPLMAVANAEDGPELIKYLIEKEGGELLADYKREPDQSKLIERFFDWLYILVGAKYKVQDINGFDQNGQMPMHYLYASKDMLELVTALGGDVNKSIK